VRVPVPRVFLNELDAQSPVLLSYWNGPAADISLGDRGELPTFDGPIVEPVVVRDPWPSPENRWNLGRVEYPEFDLASRMTARDVTFLGRDTKSALSGVTSMEPMTRSSCRPVAYVKGEPR
jgi:hypothetical protein